MPLVEGETEAMPFDLGTTSAVSLKADGSQEAAQHVITMM